MTGLSLLGWIVGLWVLYRCWVWACARLVADEEMSARLSALDEVLPRGRQPD